MQKIPEKKSTVAAVVQPYQEPHSVAVRGLASAGAANSQLPPYVRLQKLREIVPLSNATIWRLSRDPKSGFPKPIKLSPRTTAWKTAAVLAYLADKEAA